MQSSLRLGLVLLFLFITVKSQAALAPGKESIWPKPESLTPNRVELSSLEIENFDTNSLHKKFKMMQKIFPSKNASNESSTGIPQNFLESAHELRELQKMALSNDKLKPQILEFLSQCSKDSSILSTLNGLCLSHAMKLAPRADHLFSQKDYPHKIWELAQLAM